MLDVRQQAVTGVIPPQQAEARIREAWPSVARFSAVAHLGRILTNTVLLAPVAWLLMAPFYFLKVLPLFARRYLLSNRRLMIQAGWGAKPIQEIPLAEIDDVRLVTDANSTFFRSGTLEIVSKGQVRMTLPGTPEPDSFRIAILNACLAWVPGKASACPFVPASATTAS